MMRQGPHAPSDGHRVRPLLAGALLCAILPTALRAQGGWRQWDVYLRDGTRIEANPLGAPDDAHVAISVGGITKREAAIPRARVAYIAAQAPAGSLPAVPRVRSCDDAVVRRDGRRTTGRVTLARVEYSEGTITQRGNSIDLRDVAYLVFARPCRTYGRHEVRRERENESGLPSYHDHSADKVGLALRQDAAPLDRYSLESNMFDNISLGLAARRTLRLLGALGALAIGTAAGAQQARSDSARNGSPSVATRQGGTKSPSAQGGISGGVLKQGGTKSPSTQGGINGGVLKQGGTKSPSTRGGINGGVLKQGASAAPQGDQR